MPISAFFFFFLGNKFYIIFIQNTATATFYLFFYKKIFQMGTSNFFTILYASVISLPTLFLLCSAADNITPTQSLTDGMTLVSSDRSFELGFFSPGSSKNRYLGIWYKITPDVVVWVANRNNPLHDSNGSLIITSHGSLRLLNRTRGIIWSSNTSSMETGNNPVAQLLESGNFVVGNRDSLSSKIYAWQSFDYPSDNFLAHMKVGWDFKSGLERHITAWKSADDPSIGDSTYRLNITGMPQIITAAGSTRKTRSGLWDGVEFRGIVVVTNPVFEAAFVSNENESYVGFKQKVNAAITRLKLNPSGSYELLVLENGSKKWDIMYTQPYEPCDSYGYCGPNGICKINRSPICECLEGFVPRSQNEWEVLNWSNGCTRKMPLDCRRGEGFIKLVGVKLPDLLEFWLNKSMSLHECKEMCLKNCSCTAYANSDIRDGGSGCLLWFGDLVDVRELRVQLRKQDVYIRLSASAMKSIQDENIKKRLKTIIPVSILAVCIFSLVVCCIIWKARNKKRGLGYKKVDIKLPLFDLATISSATKNFSPEHMIGSGGFGSVFKGNLSTGQEIAVKRLSKYSVQGLKEFKNEVDLIAKLQHRNLVALLGCCIQRDELMLIYEYMPNKSLDHFIFDNKRSTILCWKQQFDIIMGIARGLLYLHRDSKLQIIHRDLKAANILLDNNLNPKISDFGLARMFSGDEKETRTRRIIGTYGYMSPEYAIDGKFSVKSDVFSFGVLLLEIVSGKKNRRFNHPDHHHNLLGHAWLLWNEGRALDLMDASLNDSSVECQLVRCIQVGLLCVQKFPQDRPTMSSVIFMLENEGTILPQPQQPGFFTERSSNDDSSISRNKESGSQNVMTMTKLDGR
ncbi:G-type lectin S-receptor-like serine/threonine-protein kinase At4g27290 [Ziziphus jujuba]|uniref:Receptor-like serine/threonine-protein kinase n=1 Tax=Ziziphus jujuba TaxID=326968 RepID=A0ABM4AH57_ZIZJJ|nr:G-type lectin S-receptor-like serine/threonine-protein kinase At4g27290 [Ziziphus jujuba]